MKQQKRTISNGKTIEIYDDVFPPHLRHHHLLLIQDLPFRLCWSGTSLTFWQQKDKFFQTSMCKEAFDDFKFENEIIAERLIDYEIKRSWVTVSSPFSTYYFHVDESDQTKDRLTLLYYVNTRWDRDWGGETLFANDDGECEVAVEYKPGRIVIFDSFIEHKPSPISTYADEYRFIFVLQLERKNI